MMSDEDDEDVSEDDDDDEHSQWTYSDYEHKENHLQKELKNTIQQPVADPTRSSSATSYINSPIS